MSDLQHSKDNERERVSSLEESLAAADEDFAPTDEVAAAAPEPATAIPPVKAPGPAPWALGLYHLLSVVVVVAATLYGYLAATTGRYDPLILVNELRGLGPDAIYVLTLAGGGIAILSLLGSIALVRALVPARERSREALQLLAGISELDLEREKGWMDESLRVHPGIDRFLTATLGTYRLLQTRVTKYVSLEGELFRLEKSLAQGRGIDLDTTYDHPGAGRLACAVQKLFDQREDALRRSHELQEQLTTRGGEICTEVAEAAHWNSSALDGVNLQAQALDGAGRRSAEAAARLREEGQRHQKGGAARELIAQIRGELTALPNADSSLALSAATGTIKDLVARGGKLAIQSAMETARLGDRAGKLTGMSQELQNLITEFRAVATQLESLAGNQAKFSAVLTDTRRRLDGFDPGAGVAQVLQNAAAQVGELETGLRLIGDRLGRMSSAFNGQTVRLDRIGSSVAELSGAAYESVQPAGDDGPDEAAQVQVERFDPFAAGPAPDSPALAARPPAEPEVADLPLDPAADLRLARVSPFGDEDAGESAEPGLRLDIETFASDLRPARRMQTDWTAPDEPAAAPRTPAARPASFPGALTGDSSARHTSAISQEPLSPAPEKVYDLSEFDAVPLDDEEVAVASTTERIYDLVEFGAVPVT